MSEKINILIVEDDTPVALMIVFLLARAGCETEVATPGKKAMQMAEAGNFDLITLDADLPDGNGFTLCSRLKENPHLHDTPHVFVSGRTHEECQQRAVELGTVDYITKPFDALDFAPRLLSYIKIEGESDFIAAAKGRFQKI